MAALGLARLASPLGAAAAVAASAKLSMCKDAEEAVPAVPVKECHVRKLW